MENSEDAIRKIIESRAKAVHAGDVDAMLADVADDIMSFDVLDPLRCKGIASSRERAAEWVSSYEDAVSLEMRDVRVEADGDVAFTSALSHVTGKQKNGAEVNMWFRTTLCFRRTRGRWLIVHEHSSVPFDPESGQPSLDLKPD